MTVEQTTGTDDIVRAVRAIHRNLDGYCIECTSGYEYGGVSWPCDTWKATQTAAERAEEQARQEAEAREREAADLAERYRSLEAEHEDLGTRYRQVLIDRAQTAADLVHLIGLDRAAVLLDVGPDLLGYYERVSDAQEEEEQ